MKKLILSLSFALVLSAETMTVCEVDSGYKPVQGKCFVVPAPVMDSFNKFVADNKVTTTDADGKSVETPKYASVWDMLVKHFVGTLVLPILDRYPTPEVAAAKAAAENAAKQIDAAKASALQ